MTRSISISAQAILVLAWSALAAQAADSRVLEFRWEAQNVPVIDKGFRAEPPPNVRNACPELAGEARYGSIPHRLLEDAADYAGHFVHFAAVYSPQSPPALLVDADRDGALECGERVELVRHPRDPQVLFRTVVVAWNDGGPERSRRYRVRIPAALAEAHASYAIDLVDVPVARWTEGDRTAVWVLHDGNYDGLFGSKFGDGLLIDAGGGGELSVSPQGPSFRSFHEPIALPWAAYRVVDVERSGARLVLEPAGAGEAEPVYREGDLVPGLSCESIDGEPIRFGGEAGRHQVLFFWVSSCGSCLADATALAALAGTIGPERLSVVGISMDEDRGRSREFVRLTGAGWPQCFSDRVLWDNALARRFAVDSPSDFVVIDPSGRLELKSNGMNVLEGLLEQVTASSGSRPPRSAAAGRPR